MLSYESGLNNLSINSPYPYMIKHGPGYYLFLFRANEERHLVKSQALKDINWYVTYFTQHRKNQSR